MLLDNFKTEMMERFQEEEERIGRQEEKNAEQDLEIARQSETILKLKEALAEQKKTTEDQNETIQTISTYPALRDLLRTPSPPPQDTLLFIMGGYNGKRLSSTETFPRSRDCSPPSLPLGRSSPTSFVTSEPNALVATCGGSTMEDYIESNTPSCLVLDPINHIGVFVVGGDTGNNSRTSGNAKEVVPHCHTRCRRRGEDIRSRWPRQLQPSQHSGGMDGGELHLEDSQQHG